MKTKHTPTTKTQKILFIIVVLTICYWILRATATKVISPCPSDGCHNVSIRTVVVIETPPVIGDEVDAWVDKYAKKYGKNRFYQNRTKALIHFLLLREQNYGGTNNCGDSGLACGPLQFHEATYIGYRKLMIQEGLTTFLGSRLDMENAIETASWAINNGRENAWGPVARGEIKL